eukprot:scaffold3849_cov179-Amphora_coffeaeformis.AAC.2
MSNIRTTRRIGVVRSTPKTEATEERTTFVVVKQPSLWKCVKQKGRQPPCIPSPGVRLTLGPVCCPSCETSKSDQAANHVECA